MGAEEPRLIALVDDHPAVLRGVAELLVAELVPNVEATTWSAMRDLLAAPRSPDLVILDVQLNDGNEPENNVKTCSARGWRVLLYTMETNPAVLQRCFRAGAAGLVGKHEELSVLGEAANVVLSGEPYLNSLWARAIEDAGHIPELSPRESEVLTWYARGLPLKSVAHRMGISSETAKAYLLRVRRKYDDVGRPAVTKVELTMRALEDGFIDVPVRNLL